MYIQQQYFDTVVVMKASLKMTDNIKRKQT